MAREAIVGTVHKPKQPPIPEPKGWLPFVYSWVTETKKGWLVPDMVGELLETQEDALKMVEAEETPVRLLHIGSAPKVPVEAIRRALDSFDLHAAPTDYAYVEELRSWLSAQEGGDK